MIPYLKYFLVKIDPNKPAPVAPTYEDWCELRGYEPSKVNPNYEDFVRVFLERSAKRPKRGFTICCVAIGVETSNVITETEQRSDFIRWLAV